MAVDVQPEFLARRETFSRATAESTSISKTSLPASCIAFRANITGWGQLSPRASIIVVSLILFLSYPFTFTSRMVKPIIKHTTRPIIVASGPNAAVPLEELAME